MRWTAVVATGGSTNAVLHLLAVAAEAGVPLEIDDFDRISRRTPVLADLKRLVASSRPTWSTRGWHPAGAGGACWTRACCTATA